MSLVKCIYAFMTHTISLSIRHFLFLCYDSFCTSSLDYCYHILDRVYLLISLYDAHHSLECIYFFYSSQHIMESFVNDDILQHAKYCHILYYMNSGVCIFLYYYVVEELAQSITVYVINLYI